jgi:hypothetical protein
MRLAPPPWSPNLSSPPPVHLPTRRPRQILLGRERAISWGFNLGRLYRDTRVVDGPALVAPFEPDEIKAAVFGMDRTSALGPDGLGPSFYWAAWPTVAPSMLRLFAAVRDRNTNLGLSIVLMLCCCPKQMGSSL